MDATHTPEEWRPVVDWEGKYEVSNLGRVRSVCNDRVKALTPNGRGYLVTGLGHGRIAYVHRLVLDAFVGPRPEGMVSCHNNGDRSDNRLANLRYGTSSENNTDTVTHGNHWQAKKTHCKHGHEFTPENTMLRSDGGRKCWACHRRNGRETARRAWKKARQERNAK